MRLPVLCLALSLAACAPLPRAQADEPAVLLLGEQHDAPSHQEKHREVVERLASRQQLAALVLEMAQQGASTAGLPVTASEEEVRAALGWNVQAWPWAPYAPAIMAAVRAGAPVAGANLAPDQMRQAMGDVDLDRALAEPQLRRQHEAIRTGHCGMLPEARVAPMTRVQIARDRAMAQALAAAAVPGKTVVLLAGSAHVDEAMGVPRHMPAGLAFRAIRWPPQPPQRDYCEEWRQRGAPARPAG